jgi:hypothetical protein
VEHCHRQQPVQCQSDLCRAAALYSVTAAAAHGPARNGRWPVFFVLGDRKSDESRLLLAL